MTVTNENINRASVKEEGFASTETSDLEAMLYGLHRDLTQDSLVGELPTTL